MHLHYMLDHSGGISQSQRVQALRMVSGVRYVVIIRDESQNFLAPTCIPLRLENCGRISAAIRSYCRTFSAGSQTLTS